MTLIMSAGMVQPGADAASQKKLAEMAAMARAAQLSKRRSRLARQLGEDGVTGGV